MTNEASQRPASEWYADIVPTIGGFRITYQNSWRQFTRTDFRRTRKKAEKRAAKVVAHLNSDESVVTS